MILVIFLAVLDIALTYALIVSFYRAAMIPIRTVQMPVPPFTTYTIQYPDPRWLLVAYSCLAALIAMTFVIVYFTQE